MGHGRYGRQAFLLDADTADPIARTIAAIGLALGFIGTILAVLNYRRDRPQLELRWDVDASVPEFDVSVVNRGRQPLAIRGVEVADWRPPFWVRRWRLAKPFRWLIRWRRGDLSYGSLSLTPLVEIEAPRVLGPGEFLACPFDAKQVLVLCDTGRDVWVLVRDALGGHTTGKLNDGAIEVLRVSVQGR